MTGEWISETEVIESASELVELYNPAEVYAAFGEAAREAAGFSAEPTAEGDLLDSAGIAPEETVSLGEDPYAAAADSWAAGQPDLGPLDDTTRPRRGGCTTSRSSSRSGASAASRACSTSSRSPPGRRPRSSASSSSWTTTTSASRWARTVSSAPRSSRRKPTGSGGP